MLGGVALYLAGAETVATGLWIAAGVVPIPFLVWGIISDVRSGSAGVDVIALLAIGGALALGEFLTAAIVGLMLATGQYLEAYAAGRAERELTALIERAPRTAHRVEGDAIETVDIDDIIKGDRLLVQSGEVVPVDGIILSKAAVLDESALTGESMPVERAEGALVASGVVNGAGSFEMRALAKAEDSTYAGVVRLVRQAQQERSPAVRLADRWATWFVPLAIGLAALAWIVSGESTRALAVVVVATPCPLLLAVPIAIVSGISRAAKRGIVFRGGAALESLARVDMLLLDKTGTVTVGLPVLRRITTFDHDIDGTEVLRLAAAVDQASTHILAKALVEEAHHRDLRLPIPTDVNETAGGGVVGSVDEHVVSVGNIKWLLGDQAEPAEVARFRRKVMRMAPLTVFIAVDGDVVAAASFDDVIRPDAAGTIRSLRRLGIRKIVMATGDHPVVAQSVGLAVGVDLVLAECTPQEKVEALTDMRAEGVTAMVGDGINDAPALAAADVGVAMGARGATASSEAADVVIMVDRLQRLVTGIEIAHRSRRIALQSVIVGMGLSLIAMVAAALGFLPPIAGALIQEVIDVIAILNALRALTGDRPLAGTPRLSPELSRELRADHDELMPRLQMIGEAADRLDDLPRDEALVVLQDLETLLLEEILPHEEDDERRIYPEIEGVLGGADPLQSMSRAHREIFHLTDRYCRIVDEITASGPDAADLQELRRLLYGLHAILRLHFDQEEELYASLDEEYAGHVADRSLQASRD